MKRLLRHVSQILPGVLGLGFAAFVLRSADLPRALGLLGSLGWRLPLLLVPNLAVTLIGPWPGGVPSRSSAPARPSPRSSASAWSWRR